MTTHSFVQYDVLKNIFHFQRTLTPGLIDNINENKNDLTYVKNLLKNDQKSELKLLSPLVSKKLLSFLENTTEINLNNSKTIILDIEIIDDIRIGNINIISKNLDNSKTYVNTTTILPLKIIDLLHPPTKYPTMAKCQDCLGFYFDEDHDYNFTGNISGYSSGERNGQKKYNFDLPNYSINPPTTTNYTIFWKPGVTYTGTDYYNNPININNQHKWVAIPTTTYNIYNASPTSVPFSTFLSTSSFFHSSSMLVASCSYHDASPLTAPLWNWYGHTGVFYLQAQGLAQQELYNQGLGCKTFTPNPGDSETKFNCDKILGCIVAAPGGNFQYNTFEECEAGCKFVKCVNGDCIQLTGSSAGPDVYATIEECLPKCGTSWNCTDGGCIPISGSSGQYASQAECEYNCVVSYRCIEGFGCVPVQGPGGTYPTFAACDAVCQTSWNCTDGGCIPISGSSGQYTSEYECNFFCQSWDCDTIEGCIPALGSSGEYLTFLECEDKCPISQSIAYQCEGGDCYPIPSGSASGSNVFNTLIACETSCSNTTYQCIHGDCYPTPFPPIPGLPVYPTLIACEATCSVYPTYIYQCVNGDCFPIQSGSVATGSFYNTLIECQVSCSASIVYQCIEGNCYTIPSGSASGSNVFNTLIACEASCSVPSFEWICSSNTCIQFPSGSTNPAANTIFATEAECVAQCKYKPPSTCSFCKPLLNQIINPTFTGLYNWIYQDTQYSQWGGEVEWFDSVDQGAAIQLWPTDLSYFISQPNTFQISCSYTVCIETNFVSSGFDPGLYITIPNGPNETFTFNLTPNSTQPLTFDINAVTTDLTIVVNTMLETSGQILYIPKVCVTLMGCPEIPGEDCVIEGEIFSYVSESYDCLCPTINGVIATSNVDGNCIYGSGLTVKKQISSLNPIPLSTDFEPTQIYGRYNRYFPVLYYNYNSTTGLPTSSIGTGSKQNPQRPSPLFGDPRVINSRFTFDFITASFWRKGNFDPTFGGQNNSNTSPNPPPFNRGFGWSLMRTPDLTNYNNPGPPIGLNPPDAWYGGGAFIEITSSKTYYVALIADDSFRFKISGSGVNLTIQPPAVVLTGNSANYGLNQTVLPSVKYSPTTASTYSSTSGLNFGANSWYGNPYISQSNTEEYPYLCNNESIPPGGNSLENNFFPPLLTTNFNPNLIHDLNSGTGGFPGSYQGNASMNMIHIYPVSLTPGCYRIELAGRLVYNHHYVDALYNTSFGGVILDMTLNELLNASHPNDLNIIWNSKTNLLNNLSAEGAEETYAACPSGYTELGPDECDQCLFTSGSLSIPCGDCIECKNGFLYTGHVVDKGGPSLKGRGPGGIVNTSSIVTIGDWNIPGESEWNSLVTYLNGFIPSQNAGTGALNTISGGKMKDYTRDLIATCWKNPNIGAQTDANISGWAGVPGGKITPNTTTGGVFDEFTETGYWWSANSFTTPPVANANLMAIRYLKYNSPDVYRDYFNKNLGCSIRLVRPSLPGEGNGSYVPNTYQGNNGKLYNGIVINNQVWITENLAETKYNNNTPIQNVLSNNWSNLSYSSSKYASYGDNLFNVTTLTGNLDPLTGECLSFPSYYVFKKCGSNNTFLAQPVSGSTTFVSGSVLKDSNFNCWEFFEISDGLPLYPYTYSPTNYFSGSNYVYNNCNTCSEIHTIYTKFQTKNC